MMPMTMWRLAIGGILPLVLFLLCVPAPADAQPSTKVPRIGWLASGSSAGGDRSVKDFQQGLRDLGYTEGRSVAIEFRYASGNAERLPDLAAELVRLQVDVIVTTGGDEALAAKRTTRAIPIVAMEVGVDPVKAGLVSSLARPEGNVTGLITLSEALWEKRLGLLREFVPRLSRLAVLWNPTNPGNVRCIAEIRTSAAAMSMQLRALETVDGKALERALTEVARDPPDALAVCWDGVTLEHAGMIADFALRRRLPTVAAVREFVQAGMLLSYGADLSAHRRRAARYVDKILKGTKPAGLPVEQPTNFDLVVNLTTAKGLGLAVPPSILIQTEEVIQ